MRKSITFKSQEQIELIRDNCLLVSKVLTMVGVELKSGITGLLLDKRAEELIRDHGAEPGFKGYGGFPSTLCISMNDQVVHGIPSDVPFRDGDIISVDCGVLDNRCYGDAAFTFALNDISSEQIDLLSTTRRSLSKAIEQSVVGKRTGDIGYAVQHLTEKVHGYGVVRELVGHGIGENLHEAPEVPNYGRKGKGVLLKEGMVIAIEPMINLGTKDIVHGNDGWTIKTKDGKVSAHYEHTVAIRSNGPDILSDHSIIEEAVKNNPELVNIT